MGKILKKDKQGEVTKYISRAKVLKKIQLSLKDFRRLCILKGVYPREPPKKLQRSGKTYYHLKDINFLQHDKILGKFRELKAFNKKIRKLKGRGEKVRIQRMLQRSKPAYNLNHLIKERYPTFVDALRDLDDPLCLINLFANFSASRILSVPRSKIENCIRLSREFNLYCIKTHALQKVFLSIKGIYYQVQIEGQNITWIQPYQLPNELPVDVDYKIMLTFLEFYESLMKFINFKLFSKLNIQYPLEMDYTIENSSYFTYKAFILKNKDNFEKVQQENLEQEKYKISETFKNDKEVQQLQNAENPKGKVFKDLVIYLSTEVPRQSLEFVILCGGGQVHWQGDETNVQPDSNTITHFVTDRNPDQIKFAKNREYIQPQWIYDCFNNGIILPVREYAPGQRLPPHLSPFIDDKQEGYLPSRQKEIMQMKGEKIEEEEEEQQGQELLPQKNKQEEKEEEEEEIQQEKQTQTKQKQQKNKTESQQKKGKSSKQQKEDDEEEKNDDQNDDDEDENDEDIEEKEEAVEEEVVVQQKSKNKNKNKNNKNKSQKVEEIKEEQPISKNSKKNKEGKQKKQKEEDGEQSESEEEVIIEDEQVSDEVAEEIDVKGKSENEYDFEREATYKQKLKQQKTQEEKDLARKMISKKNQNLLKSMSFKKDKKVQEIQKLKDKRKVIEKKQFK